MHAPTKRLANFRVDQLVDANPHIKPSKLGFPASVSCHDASSPSPSAQFRIPFFTAELRRLYRSTPCRIFSYTRGTATRKIVGCTAFIAAGSIGRSFVRYAILTLACSHKCVVRTCRAVTCATTAKTR